MRGLGRLAGIVEGRVAASLEKAWVLWLEGGGCDGCTMSVLGATSPRLEELLGGGLTRTTIELVHPVLALDSGAGFLSVLERARRGEVQPYVLVVEGAVFDESGAGEGSFSSLGRRDGTPVTVAQWVSDLAPGAAAVMAIGTCATSGGIPAARGSVTGAMGVAQYLPPGFATRSGLPVVNVPGCAASGDAFIEALSYVFLHLDGLVPLDLDDQGRPRWLFAESTPVGGDDQVMADCPVPARGWINHLGGCASVGGTCNGCTRPDFPDVTVPLTLSRTP